MSSNGLIILGFVIQACQALALVTQNMFKCNHKPKFNLTTAYPFDLHKGMIVL